MPRLAAVAAVAAIIAGLAYLAFDQVWPAEPRFALRDLTNVSLDPADLPGGPFGPPTSTPETWKVTCDTCSPATGGMVMFIPLLAAWPRDYLQGRVSRWDVIDMIDGTLSPGERLIAADVVEISGIPGIEYVTTNTDGVFAASLILQTWDRALQINGVGYRLDIARKTYISLRERVLPQILGTETRR